jgi:hypothetical protein
MKELRRITLKAITPIKGKIPIENIIEWDCKVSAVTFIQLLDIYDIAKRVSIRPDPRFVAALKERVRAVENHIDRLYLDENFEEAHESDDT